MGLMVVSRSERSATRRVKGSAKSDKAFGSSDLRDIYFAQLSFSVTVRLNTGVPPALWL